MPSRLLTCISAAALFSVPGVMAEKSERNDEPVVYEIRRAVVPESEESKKPLWTNPLPPPEFQALLDDIIDHLRANFTKVPQLPVVYHAVIADDPAWLEELLSQGMSPDERTAANDTPLCAAARLGRLECARILLLAGADPNLSGSDRQPPLALAALRRPSEMIETLLVSGADPNAKYATPVDGHLLEQALFKDLRSHLEYDRGVTPLMACSSRGDVEGVVALMRHGAKTSVCTTKFHRYPINFAAAQRYIFLMRILLGRPPDAEPDILITVDLSEQRAWLCRNGEVVEETKISTGREGYDTPAGRYVITDKHLSHKSTLYHVQMPWFQRLNCSAIGLHSGYVTGRPASHGCIRLPSAVAKKFFSLTKVGDEVEIVR